MDTLQVLKKTPVGLTIPVSRGKAMSCLARRTMGGSALFSTPRAHLIDRFMSCDPLRRSRAAWRLGDRTALMGV